MDPANPALDDYVRTLPPAREPRICLLPTAGGDSVDQIRRFYAAFGDQLCETSSVSLFRLGTHPVPLREHLLAQDVIYVGGGSLVNLLALWRAHGVDAILREAWQAGIVLAGLSAGSMCWFEHGVTKSGGAPAPAPALGFLPGSNSVHYDGEPERRPVFRDADPQRRDRAGLGRRRRRRPPVPRHPPRRGRELAAAGARVPGPRGGGGGRGGGDRAAPARPPAGRGPHGAAGRRGAARAAGGAARAAGWTDGPGQAATPRRASRDAAGGGAPRRPWASRARRGTRPWPTRPPPRPPRACRRRAGGRPPPRPPGPCRSAGRRS